MRRMSARDIMAMSQEEIWALPDEKLVLEFDDGVFESNTRRTIVSWYCWEVHRKFQKTPLYTHHHIGNEFPSIETTLSCLSRILRSLHTAYTEGFKGVLNQAYNREDVWRLFCDIQNELMNVLNINLEGWEATSDVFDLLELYDHPEIEEERQRLLKFPTQANFTKAYDRGKSVFMKAPELSGNPIVRGLRGGLIKMNQMLQIIIGRGYLTEADGFIFREAIRVGFFDGIVDLHDSMIESCSAKKALQANKTPLREVEYFNRRMQLSSHVVTHIVWQDCQTTQYSRIHVNAMIFPDLTGKHFLDPATGEVGVITTERRDLIGKDIDMRSAYYCNHRGDGGVCHVCFGDLAWSLPEDINLGHVCITELCEPQSQLVMSTKHYDGSSEVDDLYISEHDAKYIEALPSELLSGFTDPTERVSVKLRSRLEKMDPFLILPSAPDNNLLNASGLTGITNHTELGNLSVHDITSFREIIIRTTNLEGETKDSYVSACQGNRFGSLSRQALRYIQTHGYTIDRSGMYIVDLSQWDYSHNILTLPLKHMSMLDHVSDVKRFLRSPSNKEDKRITSVGRLIDYHSPVEALLDFHALVMPKTRVNIAHLEVILLSLMRTADDPDDWRLPQINQPAMFEEHAKLIAHRSAGCWMGYERQPEIIEDVDSYDPTIPREPHMLDPFILMPG